MRVSVDGPSQQAVSTAGAAYGALWAFVIGTRLLFTYGANDWYTTGLSYWLFTNGITVDALTAALIFMALSMNHRPGDAPGWLAEEQSKVEPTRFRDTERPGRPVPRPGPADRPCYLVACPSTGSAKQRSCWG